MPSRNVLKLDIADGYYHVYTRGVSRLPIYLEHDDYTVFLNLLKRYLSKEPTSSLNHYHYPHLFGKLELLAYCLMPNHFHLLIYQHDKGAMQQLMHGLMTSYSRYFNRVYRRTGPLFESRYKASLINNQSYLEHISRYIHLNPKEWRDYPYTSLPYYLGKRSAEWLQSRRILELFNSVQEYKTFTADHESHKKILKEIKYALADY